MRAFVLTLVVVVFGLGLLSTPALSQQKGGEGDTGPYDVDSKYQMQPMETRLGYVLGSKAAVFVETPNRIFIANRGEVKIPKDLPPATYKTLEGMMGVDVKGAFEENSRRSHRAYISPFNGTLGSLGLPAAHQRPVDMHNTILVVDGSGKLIESWTQWDSLFIVHDPYHLDGTANSHDEGGRGPHSVKISPYDPERHVWIVDDDSQQVFKFTNDGKKLVMTLGEHNVAGTDEKHFGKPTDIAFWPDGSFFVSDGYENARIVKFDKNGKFLMAWGTPGNGPAQFHAVHSIDTDPRNHRVYVADRDNHRIQVFDENGKHLDTWPNIFQPYHIMVTADGYLGVSDGQANKMLKYDMNGKLVSAWGTQGVFPGMIWGVHGFHVDGEGNLIVAEAFGGRTQKFRPKPGADRAQLIGPPVQLMPKK